MLADLLLLAAPASREPLVATGALLALLAVVQLALVRAARPESLPSAVRRRVDRNRRMDEALVLFGGLLVVLGVAQLLVT